MRRGFGPGAEEGGADADQGGSFFDGDFEVAGHAHRELAKIEAGVVAGERFAQRAEVAKTGAGGIWIFIEGSDSHQPAQGKVRKRLDAVKERAEIGGAGIEAGFGGLVAELHFEKDGQGLCGFGGGFVESFGEAERVDGVDGVEERSGFSGLVGLQMADEVNFRVHVELGEAGALRFEFLHAIFAEESEARGDGFGNGFGGVEFGDGHEADVAAAAAGAAAGCGNAILNEG